MKLLAFDTSTKYFSVALSDGDKVVASRTLKNDRVLSSKIISAIDQVFQKSGFQPKQIDGIAVGLGPGSFTSLRVGLATAKGLAYAMKKPVIGVPSLDVTAMNVKKGSADYICVLCDAKRSMVYAAVYECLEDGTGLISDYILSEPQKILKMLKGNVSFVGDGIALYKDLIEQKSRLKSAKFSSLFVEEKKWYPSAKNLSRIARDRFEYKDFDDIDTLVPLYLYPEDCQVRSYSC